jgi:hypothetical protein
VSNFLGSSSTKYPIQFLKPKSSLGTKVHIDKI